MLQGIDEHLGRQQDEQEKEQQLQEQVHRVRRCAKSEILAACFLFQAARVCAPMRMRELDEFDFHATLADRPGVSLVHVLRTGVPDLPAAGKNASPI